MTFTYSRNIHLFDTDAAGVVYFANVLKICHEAYEESLHRVGINLQFFVTNFSLAIPITHASVDFYCPIYWGDRIQINLIAQQLNNNEFQINYEIFPNLTVNKSLAKANTKHVCISTNERKKIELPLEIVNWLMSF